MIYMKQALFNAQKAFEIEEVPVGCVIVNENRVIAEGFNKRNYKNNVLYHAEIIAINEACTKLKNWRLENCVLYVTVEPCAMCAGAILQARISKLVFGCKNEKAGCAGSVLNILDKKKFNHQVEIISGIMENECREIMSKFFRNLRHKENDE